MNKNIFGARKVRKNKRVFGTLPTGSHYPRFNRKGEKREQRNPVHPRRRWLLAKQLRNQLK